MRYTALVLSLVGVTALAAERPTDKDIKQLIEQLHQARDRFEDQLDGKLKREVLRGAEREVDVERVLDDLQENVGRWKDRFTADYSASAEGTTVLQQASLIHRFMSTQPPDLKGASEWNRFAATLSELASAYGTAFPLATGATARRLNDREVQKASEDVAKAADAFKKEIDASLKANKVDETSRLAALAQVDALKAAAKTLASRLKDGKPASGEAKVLIEQAGALQAASPGRSLPPAAQTAWISVRTALEKVAQGFGMSMPPVVTTASTN